GNWKMNLDRAAAEGLAHELADAAGPAMACEMVLCPPAPYLIAVADAVAGSPIGVGGQDCHAQAEGAHTGDIAATMLRDVGCSYVIVGHSERRADHGESDAAVRAKAEAARAAGLVPIVCVGETEAQRDAGETLAVVGAQVAGSVPEGLDGTTLVVAYEPVWAIGTGRTPTVDDVAAVHASIRAALAARTADPAGVRILYGGSVKPSNAAELLAVANVDGALVGGASLKAADFLAIARSL
ncbi:MAG TPA: triose-phosphate isomerase, partial [Thalassobaculum sp.]